MYIKLRQLTNDQTFLHDQDIGEISVQQTHVHKLYICATYEGGKRSYQKSLL
jgi:hypothetical protein